MSPRSVSAASVRYTVSSEMVGTRFRTALVDGLDIRVRLVGGDEAHDLEPLMSEPKPGLAKAVRQLVDATRHLIDSRGQCTPVLR